MYSGYTLNLKDPELLANNHRSLSSMDIQPNIFCCCSILSNISMCLGYTLNLKDPEILATNDNPHPKWTGTMIGFFVVKKLKNLFRRIPFFRKFKFKSLIALIHIFNFSIFKYDIMKNVF